VALQYALKVFEYEDKRPFRIIDVNGEPWFALSDVCRELDIANVGNAAARLDDDEKSNIRNPDATSAGGNPNITIISEPGLYKLIFRSNKPVAKDFMNWVTKEVLPSIRKTGSYGRETPAFIRRANQNRDRISLAHFSVIDEITVRLWGRFEHLGHILADTAPNGKEIRPDISIGRGFSAWLNERHPTVSDNYVMYLHWTPAKEVEALMLITVASRVL
jgi:prophage antirepressor-like protein